MVAAAVAVGLIVGFVVGMIFGGQVARAIASLETRVMAAITAVGTRIANVEAAIKGK